MILKDYPSDELPRERAVKYGISTLSNVELIALLLRTGSKDESVLGLSQKVINEIGGIEKLREVEYHQLINIKGIKTAKAIGLLACVELTKRMMVIPGKVKLTTPREIYDYIIGEVMFEQREKVYLICLNTRLEVIKVKLMSMGSNDMTVFSCVDFFKEALLCGAKKIVLIHNHPSGNPSPSNEDFEVTKQLLEMSNKLDIDCIDHLIIGEHCFYSFSAKVIIDV